MSAAAPSMPRLAAVPTWLTLSLVFFLSGCAALLFETLWFRQAGLMLGNSIWASSAVLGSFMAGLALGNGLVARRGARLERPVASYAALECVIAVVGLTLVWAFPILTPKTAPLLGALAPTPQWLNLARGLLAFALMLVPATAMGATLPLLTSALARNDADFGSALGWLYGWNTLGAVAGALLGELVLIAALGLRGTGLVAASLSASAGLLAFLACGRLRAAGPPLAEHPRLSGAAALLAATALAGAVLLALEVLWFRLLLLWILGSSRAFASLLAIVLGGIGMGGLLAGLVCRMLPRAARLLPVLAAAAGLVTTLGYARLPAVLGHGSYLSAPVRVHVAFLLMFPTSLLSGAIFTLVGVTLKSRLGGAVETTGWATLANTLGALVGAVAGGLWLLPGLGLERALFAASAVYLAIAGLAWFAQRREPYGPGERLAIGAAIGVAAVVVGLFPFGLMQNRFVKQVAGRWARQEPALESRLVAEREGLTETVLIIETRAWDEPVDYRLVTNATSMSGTRLQAQRYMRLFVWLPMALQPEARDALLISFGVGSTAQALTDSSSLRSIDVVDISRDILELGRIPFAGRQFPLDDPRVQVHVEDGRFFLLTTSKRYDLITAEPPPPKNAGIGNLYSKEYFALIRERLRPGGLATYWLPVYQLTGTDTRGLLRAFCDVFSDCTLWSGAGPEWIMMGSRGGLSRPSEAAFTRQWREAALRPRLAEVGLDDPEQLGATFIAGAEDLGAWIGSTPPLDDDHPYRLSPDELKKLPDEYRALAERSASRTRFERSPFIRAYWPEKLRENTLPRFEAEKGLNRVLWNTSGYSDGANSLIVLHDLLTANRSRTPVLWLMWSDAEIERALVRARLRGLELPGMLRTQAVSALADRDYERSERLWERVGEDEPDLRGWALQSRVLTLVLAGRRERAAELLRDASAWPPVNDPAGWVWLVRTFGLPDPLGLTTRPGS